MRCEAEFVLKAVLRRAIFRLESAHILGQIVCEFGTIDDAHQAAWTKAALSDLLGGRWPRVIGFSWWNAAFENDPLTGGWSNMRVQESHAVRAIFRHYVGAERTVISRPITRLVTVKEP
ncbi:MAG: hypothetical protein ABSA59_01230 [Terriglobia bacterium]